MIANKELFMELAKERADLFQISPNLFGPDLFGRRLSDKVTVLSTNQQPISFYLSFYNAIQSRYYVRKVS